MQIVSFNTFGLPNYMSWQRIMQEIQQKSYLRQLQAHLPAHPHLSYGAEGHVPMGNLVTASSLAASRIEFSLFPNRGKLLSAGFADWLSYKGVLITEYCFSGQKVVVMNTHTNASYLARWDPESPISLIQRDQVAFLAKLGMAQPEDFAAISTFRAERRCMTR